ncbi:hypothetical protein [Pseudomonas sp. BIC9C]|uniref:hypothetical protein n=1 Tax=Pseudomonas sp. BIC9C TaxID=3078458 RepID=UPI002AD2BEAB|nr:hypothetical protein [Pseudomonas sp. BIC9C]
MKTPSASEFATLRWSENVDKTRNALEQSAERQELSIEQLELLRWGHAKADWIDPLKPGVVDVLEEEIVIP